MNKLLVLALLAACSGGTPATKPGPGPGPGPVGGGPATPTPPDEQKPPPVAAGKPKADLIPRGILFGNPERAGVQLSPDGKTLSWLAAKNGVLNVFVAPVGKLDQAKPITSEASRPVRQYFWAYTSKHVVYLQDNAGDENFHMFRADIADGKTADLTPYKNTRAELVDLNHRFPNKLLVQLNDRNPQAHDLYEIDLLTANRTLLVQNDDQLGGYVVDTDMKVRFAIKKLPDGSTQVLAPDGKKWKVFETVPFEDAET